MRLRLRGVTRRFRGPSERPVLSGVDLDVHAGEFLAIVGPSGGGKSTLLNTIGLLDQPDDGTYEVDGAESTTMSGAERARLRSTAFGFVFQGFHLLDHRPTIDSVELPLLYRSVPRRDRRTRAAAALDRVGLGAEHDQRAALLSGGQRQRVAIARALASSAEIVVADEPTGNLDSANGERIVEILLGLRDEGRTVVLVTHDLDLARRADRMVAIRDGVLTSDERLRPPRHAEEHQRAADTGRPSTLRPLDAVRDALANVLARPARTVGLVGAVAVAVGLAVASIGIANSATAQVSARFDLHANRDVAVVFPAAGDGLQGAGADAEADAEGDLRRSAEDRLRRIGRVAGVDSAAVTYERGSTIVRATSARREVQVPAASFVGDVVGAARLTVDWTPNHAHELGPDEVLVGRDLADQLPIGDVDDGPVIEVASGQVVVAGLITRSPRMPAYLGGVLSASHPTPVFEAPARSTVLIRTASGAAQQVARQAPVALDPTDPGSLTVLAPTDPTTLRAEIEGDVRSTLLAFTAIALLAAVAALGNAMVLGVLERRAEFGLRRAVGARPVHVAALVMSESGIVGALGGVAGLVGGLGTVLGITLVRHWVPVFDLWLAPAAILGGIAVGCLGGVLAAWRATRIEPQAALRS